MDLKTIQKGNLTIALDKDFLVYKKNQMLEIFDSMDEDEAERTTNKKNQVLTKGDFEEALDRLFNLAIDIIDEKLNIDVFEFLPYTKAGLFHKTGSTLLATSGIKDVWNGDYFQIKFMDLILTPVSYAEKINPFATLNTTGNLFGQITGDGTIAYIELDWNARNSKVKPIFDAMNKPTKIEKVRNKYLKLEEMKPGYTYFDAKGNEFLYAGNLYYSTNNWCEKGEMYQNKTDYLNSGARQKELNNRAYHEQYDKYKGAFYYLKMTKKNETIINNSKNIGELFYHFVHTEFWSWNEKWKILSNPIKAVSEGRQVIDSFLDDAFYYEQSTKTFDGHMAEDFFYFEKV